MRPSSGSMYLNLGLDHINVQLVAHVRVVLQLTKAKSGNVDSLQGEKRRNDVLVGGALSTSSTCKSHISRANGSRSAGSIQVSVQLLEHVLQPLLGLFVRVDEDGLEVDGQSVPIK